MSPRLPSHLHIRFMQKSPMIRFTAQVCRSHSQPRFGSTIAINPDVRGQGKQPATTVKEPGTSQKLAEDDPYHIRLMLGEQNIWSGDIRKMTVTLKSKSTGFQRPEYKPHPVPKTQPNNEENKPVPLNLEEDVYDVGLRLGEQGFWNTDVPALNEAFRGGPSDITLKPTGSTRSTVKGGIVTPQKKSEKAAQMVTGYHQFETSGEIEGLQNEIVQLKEKLQIAEDVINMVDTENTYQWVKK